MTTALLELHTGDAPVAWQRLGFTVDDEGGCTIGSVTVRLGGDGGGLRGWTLSGAEGPAAIDGIPTSWAQPQPVPPREPIHANGATAVDHVVVFTDDRERTAAALVDSGGDLRKRVDPPPFPAPMAFVRFDTTVIEVAQTDSAGAQLWGLVAIVPDIDALAKTLQGLVGTPRPAIQEGRRIVTATRTPGLRTALAFITPRGWGR
jgi:hypothetical protein